MKGRNKNKRNKKSRSASQAKSNPGNGVQQYTGPSKLPSSSSRGDAIAVRLSLVANVSASAGGVIAYGAANNPSGYTEWSSWAALYQEYRVLSFLLEYKPHYIGFGGATTVNSQALIGYVDRNTGTATATTYSAAYNVQDCKFGNTSQPMTIRSRMSGATEAGWTNTSAPAGYVSHNLTAVGLTASQICGVAGLYLIVQFRNRF
jgi:hypothetical protein